MGFLGSSGLWTCRRNFDTNRAVMSMYIYIIGRRTQITLTDRQHAFLRDESARTGLPMTELIRRAVDATYRPHSRYRVPGLDLSISVWRGLDEAVIGRRLERVRPRPG
jgi:hypothetical protein